jgi:hypothetical protein
MASFGIVNIAPPTLSNLVATTMPEAIKLRWDTPLDDTFWQTEVWVATTNDRSTATLAFTTFDNTYIYTTTGGTTRYFWVRSYNVFGYNNGPWYPVGSTSGVSGVAGYGGVAATTSVASTSFTSGNTIDGTMPSAWNTWTSCGNVSWTTPSSGNGVITGYVHHGTTFSAIAGAGALDFITVQRRVRLYDVTAAAYVTGETATYVLMTGLGNTTLATVQFMSHNFTYRFGVLGNLILGHQYELRSEVQRSTTGTTAATLTLTNAYTSASISGNTIS